jgi:hypothetical protein
MSTERNCPSPVYGLVRCIECSEIVELLANGPKLDRCPLCQASWAGYLLLKIPPVSSACAEPANPEVSAGSIPEITVSNFRRRFPKDRSK